MGDQHFYRKMAIHFADKAESTAPDDMRHTQRFEMVCAAGTAAYLTSDDALFDADRRGWSEVTARRAEHVTIEELINASQN